MLVGVQTHRIFRLHEVCKNKFLACYLQQLPCPVRTLCRYDQPPGFKGGKNKSWISDRCVCVCAHGSWFASHPSSVQSSSVTAQGPGRVPSSFITTQSSCSPCDQNSKGSSWELKIKTFLVSSQRREPEPELDGFCRIAELPCLPGPSLSAQRWGTAAHKQTEKVKRTWRWK